MPSYFQTLEPVGFDAKGSKIERLWADYGGPFSIHQRRTICYGPQSGVSYSPVNYCLAPFKIPDFEFDQKWIKRSFCSFVREEFGIKTAAVAAALNEWPKKEPIDVIVPWGELERIVSNSEWISRSKIKPPRNYSAETLAESMYDILCQDEFGSAKNSKNNDRDGFVSRVRDAIERKERMRIVLPGFPFKDQNVLRVCAPASSPDLADVSFLMRLFNLAEAFYQVYPYGTDVIVLSDGQLYADIFGVSRADARLYLDKMREYRDRFNLQGCVSFLDMEELVFTALGKERFCRWKESIGALIHKLINDEINEGDPDETDQFRKAFYSLKAGMKRNLATQHLRSQCGPAESRAMLYDSGEPLVRRDVGRQIDERAADAAKEYAAINLILRATNIFELFFPNAIRGTVHAKEGQFSLMGRRARCSWNGVAFSKKWPKDIGDIRVTDYITVLQSDNVRRVCFGGVDGPSCYIAGSRNPAIEAATALFSSPKKMVNGFVIRRLEEGDADSFIKAGNNDPDYSWRAEQQDRSYYSALFRFRLNHYRRYGFGVCGVWEGNEFIGQFGVQVLSEIEDSLELVLFIRAPYRRRGIGSLLINELAEELRVAEIPCVFALVRPENAACRSLIEKFGGKSIRSTMHYNEMSIVYKLTTGEMHAHL